MVCCQLNAAQQLKSMKQSENKTDSLGQKPHCAQLSCIEGDKIYVRI